MDSFWRSLGLKARILLWVPLVMVLGFGVWALSHTIEPAPPRSVTISTGSETGAYFMYGKRYAEYFAANGVKLNVITSEGSADNFSRLMDPKSGVDIALMQGGLSDGKPVPRFVSVGRVFQQPIWVFYRDATEWTELAALKGKRVSVGPIGSGTQLLAMKLLARSGITPENASLINKNVKDSANGLRSGEFDAIFLALAPDTPLIMELLTNPDLKLMSMGHAEAYTRIYPFLRRITLPRGMVSLENNVPGHDSQLIANEAALVARSNLHPAIVGLLAEAAYEVHKEGGMFHAFGDYPRKMDPEYTFSDEADRFYKSGLPLLRRFFPFWIANFVERTAVIAVPLATVLYPLFKGIPWIYQWRIRRRMLRYFAELKALEKRISLDPHLLDKYQHRSELQTIDQLVRSTPVPVNYTDMYYDLRSAVELVRERIGLTPADA